MIVAFQLSMPGSPSWNGKWSGEDRIHCITKSFTGKKGEAKAKSIIDGGPYSHHWSDGWSAAIHVIQVTPSEAARLRKSSVGFSGYDWMMESICLYGKIMDEEQIAEYYRLKKESEKTTAVV